MLSGLTQDQTAQLLGINVTTLTRYYREELDMGAQRMLVGIAGNMARIAMQQVDLKAAVNAGKYMLNSRAGWIEKTETPLPTVFAAQMKTDDGNGGQVVSTVTLRIGAPPKLT